MLTLAFASSFSGLSLVNPIASRAPLSNDPVHAKMGDSLAPVVRIKDTRWDGTSSISVSFESIAPAKAAAVAVAGNAALGATLRRRSPGSGNLLPGNSAPPAGVAPKDFYFPLSTRNTAPVISFTADSLSVSYDTINPSVTGATANSPDSVAFWKKKPYKYAAPDAPELVDGWEVIETALFENYFPTRMRNCAPKIEIVAPFSGMGGSVSVQCERVGLNTSLARNMKVPRDSAEPTTAGASATAKYFPSGKIDQAPKIEITEDSVSFGMETAGLPIEEAKKLLAEYNVDNEEEDKEE